MAWTFIWKKKKTQKNNNLEYPLAMDALFKISLKLAQGFPEKKFKMWKVYRRTDRRTTDNRRSEKLTWAFSSLEQK